MKMPIIALGRQFGSGGREIGRQLAESLSVRCYDRELITLAAQRAELREELFADREEKAPNPWLFTGVYEGGPQVRRGQPAENIPPFGDRVRRRMEIEGIGPKEAEEAVRKMDKQRKKYYDTYTGRHWGAPENYDFCINSSVRGIPGTAEQIMIWVRAAW